ncbi:MAG: winged helix-turn-helix transcriptional regulator [Propioniciclava sp.]
MADIACSRIEAVMDILGRAWAGAILEAMLGGAARYTEIARACPGVSDAVLSARLRELCDRGLVTRTVNPGPPTAIRYDLTAAGRDVAPVLEALSAFAATHPEIVAPPPHRAGAANDR